MKFILLIVSLLMFGCSHDPAPPKYTGTVLNHKSDAEAHSEAKKSLLLMNNKINQLVSANDNAVTVGTYKQSMHEILQLESKNTGWLIQRLDIRNNNLEVWQKDTIKTLTRMAEKKGMVDSYTSALVTENGMPTIHYAKPIIVQQMCLACHGKPDDIVPDLMTRLKEKYPQYQITGYSVGELIGALTISRPN
jgi:Protein of unknown function (DUF3365)